VLAQIILIEIVRVYYWRGEKCTKFWWGSPKERDHSKDEGVEGRMGSEWILGRLGGGGELDLTSSGQGPVASYSYISMDLDVYRCISIDTYWYMSIDTCRYITIDTSIYLDRHINISRCTPIYRSLSINIDQYRYIYIDRHLPIYIDRLISIYRSINIVTLLTLRRRFYSRWMWHKYSSNYS
jgi:hypothetical protein